MKLSSTLCWSTGVLFLFTTMVGNTCSAVSSDSLINGLPGGGSDLGAKENLRGRSRGRDTSFQDAPNTVQGVSLGKAYVEVVKELFKEEKSDAEMRVVIDNFYKDYGIVVPPGNTVDTEGDKKVRNLQGCQFGQERLLNGACIDIDECIELEPCDTKSNGGFCVDYDWDGDFPRYKCGCIGPAFEESPASRSIHGFLKCQDVDECTQNIHDCDRENGVCTNEIGSFTCSCNAPYELQEDGKTCILPEVAQVVDPCDLCDPVKEFCGNNDVCLCADGYISPSGVGGECQLLKTCAKGNDDCSENASCYDQEDGVLCICNSGFGGPSCSPNDECTNGYDTNCDANAVCIDTPNSFVCACKTGYTGTGNTCEDVDECSSPELNNCASNAVCTNLPGTFSCACNSGLQGDGTTCSLPEAIVVNPSPAPPRPSPVDVDQCALKQDDCHRNAKCINTAVGFDCECIAPFFGDGRNLCEFKECEYTSAVQESTGSSPTDALTFTFDNVETAMRNVTVKLLAQGDIDGKANQDNKESITLSTSGSFSDSFKTIDDGMTLEECSAELLEALSESILPADFNNFITTDNEVVFTATFGTGVGPKYCTDKTPSRQSNTQVVFTTVRDSNYNSQSSLEQCVNKECNVDKECDEGFYCTEEFLCRAPACVKNDGCLPLEVCFFERFEDRETVPLDAVCEKVECVEDADCDATKKEQCAGAGTIYGRCEISEDCASSKVEFKALSTNNETTILFGAGQSTEVKTLPFTFKFLEEYDVASIKITDNGQINLDTAEMATGSGDTIAIQAGSALNFPRIAVAQAHLQGGDTYYYDAGTHIIVSWENTNFKGTSNMPKINFQVEMHKDGRIILSYGSGSRPGGKSYAAGLVYPPSSKYFPANGDPFNADGISDSKPWETKSFCFEADGSQQEQVQASVFVICSPNC